MLLLQCASPVCAATTVVSASKAPDYNIWMADSLIYGIDGAGGWYKTFKGLQEPIYRTLGAELLNHKPLISMSTAWTVFFNGEYRNRFANEQKYIYEIILMDYLKYGTSMDTSVKDLTNGEFEFTKTLYSTLAKQLSNNTLDYIDRDLSVEAAEKIWKNAKAIDGINTAIKNIDAGKKTVKKLIEEISRYLVLKETKENKIILLKASKAAAGNNKDYMKAVDDIVKALESSDLKYVQGRSIDYLWNQVLNEAWGALTNANPGLSAIEFGISGLDICFDSTKSASNNLKLALLYTVDSYMQISMSNATQTYLASKTSANAKKFRGCFEAYIQFQMFGNKFASGWLGQYLDGGVLKDTFNQIFNRENIKTAQDLVNRCKTQINGRNTILEGINKYSDIYKGKYPISTKQTQPAASIKLSKASLTMATGMTITIKATVTGKSKTVSWTSSNKSVATVKKGKITAKKRGSTIITAKANGKTAKCKIIVQKPSIKLSSKKLTITEGKTAVIKTTIFGKSKKVSWSTSNKKIATVNSKGKVTGKKAGTCTITAKANGKTAKCTIYVNPKHDKAGGTSYYSYNDVGLNYGKSSLDFYGDGKNGYKWVQITSIKGSQIKYRYARFSYSQEVGHHIIKAYGKTYTATLTSNTKYYTSASWTRLRNLNAFSYGYHSEAFKNFKILVTGNKQNTFGTYYKNSSFYIKISKGKVTMVVSPVVFAI